MFHSYTQVQIKKKKQFTVLETLEWSGSWPPWDIFCKDMNFIGLPKILFGRIYLLRVVRNLTTLKFGVGQEPDHPGQEPG